MILYRIYAKIITYSHTDCWIFVSYIRKLVLHLFLIVVVSLGMYKMCKHLQGTRPTRNFARPGTNLRCTKHIKAFFACYIVECPSHSKRAQIIFWSYKILHFLSFSSSLLCVHYYHPNYILYILPISWFGIPSLILVKF